MLSVIFLLAAVAFGVSAAYRLPVDLRVEERVFAGVPIGLATGGLLGFVYALCFGMGNGALVVPTVVLAIAASVLLWRFALWKTARIDLVDFRKRWRSRWFKFGVLAFLLLAGMLTYIMWHAVFTDGGTIYAGFSNVWGDWNQHLGQTASFAYGDNLPPEQTALAGHKITYPFLTNFLSAMLVVGGFALLTAMKVPGVLLVLSGLGMLTAFLRLTAGTKAMIVGAVLFYFFGGLGFINFFVDFANATQSLPTFLADLPREYTLTFGEVPVPNINFINTIFAYLIPQRAFLFGLPLTLTIVSLLYTALQSGAKDLKLTRRAFLAAGLVALLLPLVHTHSLVFLGLLTPGLMLLTWGQFTGRSKRRPRQLLPWLYFIGPILLLAVPQFLWISAGVNAPYFFRPQLGWTAHGDFVPWFWLKNLGLFLPLLIGSFFWLRRRNPILLQFTGAAAIVWLIANLYIFQPWDWDNSKFLVYWLVLSIPAVAGLVVWLFERGRATRIAVVALFPFLILAGAADVSRTLQPDHYRAQLFDQRGQEIAEYVKTAADPSSIWLTAQNANNPFAVLAGQRLALGYTGWLWSYGLKFSNREYDVQRIYSGDPRTPILLDKYNVDFVVIGPAERADKGYKVNEPYFAANYTMWHVFEAPDDSAAERITVYRIPE